MSLEESNKTSKKTPSQDSNSEDKPSLEDCYDAYMEIPYTNDWNDFAGG